MKKELPAEPRRYPERTVVEFRRDTLIALTSPEEAKKRERKRRVMAWEMDPAWAAAVVCSRGLHRYHDPYTACVQALKCAPPASILHAVEEARDRYHERARWKSPWLSKDDRGMAFHHMISTREPGKALERWVLRMLAIAVGTAEFRGNVISGMFYLPNPALVCRRNATRYEGPAYTLQTNEALLRVPAEKRARRGMLMLSPEVRVVQSLGRTLVLERRVNGRWTRPGKELKS